MKKYLFEKIVKLLDKKGYEVIKKGEALFVLKHYLLIPMREDAVFQIKGGKAQIDVYIMTSFDRSDQTD